MKFNFSHSIAACAAAMMLIMASCHKSGNAGIAAIASSDDIAVLTINAEDILANAGFKVTNNEIVVPEKYQQHISESKQTFLDIKGVDLKNIVMCASEESQVAMLNITDQKAFEQWLEKSTEAQATDTKGYTVYIDKSYAWLIKDNVAYFLNNKGNGSPVDLLQARIKAAEKSPLSASQIEKLGKDESVNVVLNLGKIMEFVAENAGTNPKSNETLAKVFGYDMDVISDCYSYMKAEFEGKEFEFEAKVYDQNGKEVASSIKMPKIDTAVARYCPSDPIYNFVFTIPGDFDWYPVLDAVTSIYGGNAMPREAVAIAATMLQDIEGTSVISVDKNIINAVNSDFTSLDPALTTATIAVQMKKGKAKEYVGQLKGLAIASTGSMPNSTADGFEVMIPGVPAPINVAAINDTFIVSLGQINTRGSFVGSSSIYSGESSAVAVEINKGTELTQGRTLDFSALGYIKSDGQESEGELKVSDTNMPLLETFITYFLDK